MEPSEDGEARVGQDAGQVAQEPTIQDGEARVGQDAGQVTQKPTIQDGEGTTSSVTRRRRHRKGTRTGRTNSNGVVAVVNGVLFGIAGVYTATLSIPITIIAAVLAVTLAIVVLYR
jgi:hypothetical protein